VSDAFWMKFQRASQQFEDLNGSVPGCFFSTAVILA
jgi:hypothetical protein